MMKKFYTIREKFLYKNELITDREWQQIYKQKDHKYFTEIRDDIQYYVLAVKEEIKSNNTIKEKHILKLINYNTNQEEKVIICK